MSLHLTLWLNTPSIHQGPLVRELVPLWKERFDGLVRVICEEDVPPRRLEMGWSRPDFGAAKLVIAPDQHQREKIFQEAGSQDHLHLFSGFDMTPGNASTLKTALRAPCRTAVYLEAPDTYPFWKYILRHLKYRRIAQRFDGLDVLLPMGEIGVNFYKNAGFPEEKIFPYGYFTAPAESLLPSPQKREENIYHFIYVGQVIPRKRLDLLLKALVSLPRDPCWRCHIIGAEKEKVRATYPALVEALNDHLIWHGSLPHRQVQQQLRGADCLILPSRFDGWGAVVNEALQAGCRVICSDACGAKDLVKSAKTGHIFKTGIIQNLKSALHNEFSHGPQSPAKRQELIHWAERHIHPHVVAAYLCELVAYKIFREGERPKAPWV